jgi:hypothetical protein
VNLVRFMAAQPLLRRSLFELGKVDARVTSATVVPELDTLAHAYGDAVAAAGVSAHGRRADRRNLMQPQPAICSLRGSQL